jgi:uncharacterized protein YjbI with pentapeptide repeats
MTGNTFRDEQLLDSRSDANLENQQNLQQAQEVIYQYLTNLIRNYSPETVLEEFKHLFVYCDSTVGSEGLQALYKIIFNNDEQEFKNTLKRACFILINNWSFQRKYNYIQELIQFLAEDTDKHQTLSASLKRLRSWVSNFIKSQDYQDLKLFASPYSSEERGYWSHRYTSYLLVPQYLNPKNPKEQRDLARNLSNKLKEKYKLDLAMYTARCNSPVLKKQEIQEINNPTKLGEELTDYVRKVISRTTLFNYTDQAHLFLQETRELQYQDFKKRLQQYLFFSLESVSFLDITKNKLQESLKNLYEARHKDNLNIDLLLRTSRQVVEWLTTENGREPSYLFTLLATQGNTLTLVIILLKIVLICEYVRTHLEVCIAHLIHYYDKYPEKECQWFINFLEVFNLVFAIYTENVQYNLVKVREKISDCQHLVESEDYRIFSQLKGADLRGNNLSGADIHNSDLSAADLRHANLHGSDLSQADLSLAKLSKSNMTGVILNEAELIAADLSHADLSNASLITAQLRRADLRQANLSSTKLNHSNLFASDLSGADLKFADLQYADLSYANLKDANLQGANLQYANLSNTNLQGANFAAANLSCANLEGAFLYGADLNGARLRQAKLAHAKISDVNLSYSDLSYADASNTDFSCSNLSFAFLRHVNLNNANLSDANLSDANLFGTNLNFANINNADFGKKCELFDTDTQ